MPLLFVYGSLKEGFPNHHLNRGRRLPGPYRTVEPYPLFVLNGELPCLLPTPGCGHRVVGQVFDVTEAELARMDELERVGEPGGYRRIAIAVVALGSRDEPPVEALVYVQTPALIEQPGTHTGPIAEYTLEHARSFRW